MDIIMTSVLVWVSGLRLWYSVLRLWCEYLYCGCGMGIWPEIMV